MRERWEEGDLKIAAGMFEPVIVRGIRAHVPNRFGVRDPEYKDLEGWARYEGEWVRVRSAYWADCMVWEFA
jgi:hypothetical protein